MNEKLFISTVEMFMSRIIEQEEALRAEHTRAEQWKKRAEELSAKLASSPVGP